MRGMKHGQARTYMDRMVRAGTESRRDEITKAQGEALGSGNSAKYAHPFRAAPVSPIQVFSIRGALYPGRCPGLWLSRPFGTPDRDADIGSLAEAGAHRHMADRVVHMRDGQVQKIEVNATRMDPEELEW